jgi:succinyl-CoA synthetase beta subunit
MDLLEYQGKQLFAKHGVPVPEGRPASTVDEAVAAGEDLGYPVVVKAQVLIGGRGKAGGVKLAKDRAELEENANAILGMDIKGHTVHELYIEKASEIEEEYYAAILLDRTARKPMAMLSRKGGMDIEAVADEDPSAIAIEHIDPLLGFRDFYGRKLAFEAQIADDVIAPVGAMLGKLYETFVEEDALLVEVNPLLITKDRQVVALDSKVTIDGNALFRHKETAEMRNPGAEDPQEQMAHERGLTYVKLDGNIGILGNGAGLVMSTLDVVAQAGGKPANFLDAGGGSKAEAIVDAVEVILSDPKVTAVLFNIFGGITRGDEVANGLVTAFQQLNPQVPFVVRLDGTNDEEGRKILADADLPNVHIEETMLGAADKVVELAEDGRSPSGHARPEVESSDQVAGLDAPRK